MFEHGMPVFDQTDDKSLIVLGIFNPGEEIEKEKWGFLKTLIKNNSILRRRSEHDHVESPPNWLSNSQNINIMADEFPKAEGVLARIINYYSSLFKQQPIIKRTLSIIYMKNTTLLLWFCLTKNAFSARTLVLGMRISIWQRKGWNSRVLDAKTKVQRQHWMMPSEEEVPFILLSMS